MKFAIALSTAAAAAALGWYEAAHNHGWTAYVFGFLAGDGFAWAHEVVRQMRRRAEGEAS